MNQQRPRTDRESLHGNVTHCCPVALLLIDVINDLEFDEGKALLESALPMAHSIAGLRERATRAGVPVIFVNDNFGRWKSDFRAQIEHCLQAGVRGKPIAELLQPREEDYFVLKPKHSGFHSTTLELLLKHLETRTLILTGMAGNICVLFTANDAYLRDFRLIVPSDCTASNSPELNEHALIQMRDILKARVCLQSDIDFAEFDIDQRRN